jgi:hypothetical protein
MLNVYVAGPYASAALVRVVHQKLRDHGMRPTSSWAEEATGPEDFSTMSPIKLRGILDANTRDIHDSDVILVVDHEGKGRETYAELERALNWGLSAVFVGKPALSTWHKAVLQAQDIETAIAILLEMSEAHASGLRGWRLADRIERAA